MKIIGENRYKDFFDQMIYSYGVDEGIVLDRTIYHGRTFAQLDLKGIGFEFPHDYGFWRLQDKKNLSTHERYRKLVNQIRRASWGYSENFDFIILYYNEKLYCLYYKKQFDQHNQPIPINEKTIQSDYHHKIYMLCEFERDQPITNIAPQKLIQFSRTHKMPYFVMLNDHGITVPNPMFFPFLAIQQHQIFFDMVEVYQNIENFILEIVIEEESVQSNNNKITAHGFDLKTSFRHSKKSQ